MSQSRKIFIFVALPLLVLLLGALVWAWQTGRLGDKISSSSDSTSKTCPALISPVDVSHVIAILYPGQMRGSDYKPHGGFRFDNTSNNLADIKAPLDAQIIDGSRYLEMGEVQYMFVFRHSCGLEYRFDHLKTLSAKLQAIADKLPAAKPDDSRTTNIEGKITVVAGEIIATEVGFTTSPHDASQPNVGVDFGLYDKRQKNESSKDAAWVAAHQEDGDQAIYAVCWLDWLPTADSITVKALPGGNSTDSKTSDYCQE